MSVVGAQAALSAHTTLGLGGPAGRLVEAAAEEQLVEAVRAADAAGEPVLVLGGGSNLVVADAGFSGTVVRVASRSITTISNETADGRSAVTVSVAAGEPWDGLVAWSVAEGLAGLECLSGIPGLAGATPIQNVGAYGQEVAQTITAVRAYDRDTGQVVTLTSAQCGFGYRTSMLKRVAAAAGAATGRYVVLEVSFALRRAAGPGQPGLSQPVRYPQLAATLGVAAGDRVPLEQARQAVLDLRRSKGMVLDPADPDTRSAGSFFTNPVLTAAQFAALRERAARRLGPAVAVPHFPGGDAAPEGAVKVPAAWLIEKAGFARGYPDGGTVRISTKHTLALTNPGSGTTAALLALAREITAGVRAAFGVDLVNEPTLVGVTL
ncbi:MAG TPA: UDP-N-acetylmuramate dehydrogenase [Streptosporangiaceae bacterium]|nr:UDP-N-acetylmuramate dehydrogenase [Streptosporangiaceae bacterium]